ncbi:DNA-binding response regulator, NarL/FixJ family, contains REC and HTH domains [Chryseobacterium soldanellicola]|uniref:DNA-binding response regulator, NarL/FixJ family, contains REC and HTH domains n=1 Tax=Chryseobacterium soldanellicola TaxID=311333 RepID=A0A1H1B3D0_9FLAO|nr:response regulator [Chryseobacterium soldanellicola]SDQ46281.1 DNA-binding response regulator, NarL/FixJ family, contains REC and HTH domains [Chryseobacterium soldanellicola]
MFKKVLIAEDHEIRNLGVVNTLTELQIQNFDFVNYCDEALQKIKTAITTSAPYDLLITDLSFDKDHIEQKINSGQKLIEEAKKMQPNLKIIAFSIEKRPKIINDLYKIHEINGFVSKGRNDGKDLRNTIKNVFSGEIVIPQDILNSIRNTSFEFTEYDITLIEFLAKGWKQSEIEKFFKENKIAPDSKSAIEKRLNDLRFELGAKNNIELIVICKDIGII